MLEKEEEEEEDYKTPEKEEEEEEDYKTPEKEEEDFPMKENSLPPFVVMTLELQDGNNEVECKMLAKNINSSDTFASIKFNIYVKKEEQTKESHGGGELQDAGEGVEKIKTSQTVEGGGGGEPQTVGGEGGGGGEPQTVGGEGGEPQTVGGEGGEPQTVGGEPPTEKIKTGFSYKEENVPGLFIYNLDP
ncbi:uncharacterized protein [Procambarus clarkii]|uniref:uncharacterized protein n=1 Tax=Procambarus clarkii TaxID=6728 RepID=UPI003741FA9B